MATARPLIWLHRIRGYGRGLLPFLAGSQGVLCQTGILCTLDTVHRVIEYSYC